MNHVVRFGVFEADLRSGELRKSGVRVKLQEQPYQVLAELLRRPGEVVTREELREKLWPADTFVDFDHSLGTAIKKIRQALGDSATNPRFVETLPKRGYRLIAPVDTGETLLSSRPPEKPVAHPKGWHVGAGAAAVLALSALAVWWMLDSRGVETVPPLEAIPLTSYPGIELSPSLSPSGDRVAFSWDGEKQDNFDIYVQIVGSGDALSIGTGKPIRLTTDPARDFDPAWSPDGRFVAFLRSRPGNMVGVFLVPALGGPERKIAEVAVAEFGYFWPVRVLNWSPDGKWLLISTRDKELEPPSLFLISADGEVRRKLTYPPLDSAGDGGASFAPDGRSIVFSRFVEVLVCELLVVHLNEDLAPRGKPERLTGGGQIFNPVFTPDGREIIYSSGRLGHALWRIPRSSGGAAQRLPIGENGYTPNLAAGGRLLYTKWSNQADIWRLDYGGRRGGSGEITKLISSTTIDTEPQLSPDGRRIAFMSTRSGAPEIWVADSDGANPVQLTSIGGAPTGMPRWSPSGRWIAFDNSADGRFDIHLIDANGGVSRNLTNSPSTDLEAGWSRDERWIYFMSSRGGQRNIWKIQASGDGEAVQVTRDGGNMPRESPDGKFLYFMKPEGLFRVPTTGGKEEQVAGARQDSAENLRQILRIPRWHYEPTETGIFLSPSYLLASDSMIDGEALHFLDPTTREIKQIGPQLPGPWGAVNGITVSPDGRSVLYSKMRITGDLMLVENFR